MKWSPEAETAIRKVPFFVRKKVRLRVEREAEDAGKDIVTLDDVKTTKARYLSKISAEVKGYQLDTCFGSEGCPNRAANSDHLFRETEAVLRQEDLLGFLTKTVNGPLKPHHEFRVTIADCPNACSQPQIKDIGIIGACLPRLTQEACTLCNACVNACLEDAIQPDDRLNRIAIDFDRCLKCGKCVEVCPTGTIVKHKTGFRVQLGGKLGRHPGLARELPGIYTERDVIDMIRACITFYKKHSRSGQRFSDLCNGENLDNVLKELPDLM